MIIKLSYIHTWSSYRSNSSVSVCLLSSLILDDNKTAIHIHVICVFLLWRPARVSVVSLNEANERVGLLNISPWKHIVFVMLSGLLLNVKGLSIFLRSSSGRHKGHVRNCLAEIKPIQVVRPGYVVQACQLSSEWCCSLTMRPCAKYI